MREPGIAIMSSASEQAQLEQRASARGTPQQVALRCRIALAACPGQPNQVITERLLKGVASRYGL